MYSTTIKICDCFRVALSAINIISDIEQVYMKCILGFITNWKLRKVFYCLGGKNLMNIHSALSRKKVHNFKSNYQRRAQTTLGLYWKCSATKRNLTMIFFAGEGTTQKHNLIFFIFWSAAQLTQWTFWFSSSAMQFRKVLTISPKIFKLRRVKQKWEIFVCPFFICFFRG